MSININQFGQTTVRGALDLQISKSGVIAGQISANETNTLKAGDPVKIDSAQTGNVPQFLLAANETEAIGFLAYDVKKSSLVAGDPCEVAGNFGPVMYMVAAATIAAGAAVESATDLPGSSVQTLTTNSRRGYALDPGVTGQLLRVIIRSAAAA